MASRPGLYCTHLVIDIGDVHDKVYIVAKVVAQDAADNVLRQVVAAPSAVDRRIPSKLYQEKELTEHVPCARHHKP